MYRRYEDLIVWQKAHQLSIWVYRETAKYPAAEQFGLISQMRRAAVSVAANIAEGHSRVTPKDFKHFLAIARGSVAEVDYYLILSRDLGYMTPERSTELRSLCDEVMRLVTKLMASIQTAKEPSFARS